MNCGHRGVQIGLPLLGAQPGEDRGQDTLGDRVDVVGHRSAEVLVTSPARQAANGAELVERIAASARAPVRVLSAVEEGELAFAGATSVAHSPAKKTELDGFTPPLPQAALAVGGSARAIRLLVGPKLGARELAVAVELLERTSAANLAEEWRIDPERAPTVAAGAVILAALQARLSVPLRVVRGGIREGAIAALQRGLKAAA